MSSTRREVLKGLAAGVSGAALSTPYVLRAQDAPRLTWATFTPGFVPAFMQTTIDKGLDRKHGVSLAPPIPYSALTAYFGDFTAGAFDMCFGSWETFAARTLAGVPVRFLCGINSGDLLNFVTRSDAIRSITDLRGKVLAAPTSSGTTRLVLGLVHAFYGIDLQKEATIQTVDHPLAGVTLVLADRADAALAWEPSVTMGMSKSPQLRVLLNMGEAYRQHEKAEMPYLGLAIRNEALERHPGIGARLRAVFADAVTEMGASPGTAYRAAAKAIGLPPDILVQATEAGRLKYRFASMADPAERRGIIRNSEILAQAKGLSAPIPDSFFVS
jgi:NitT/TauT family transport system substrate-binding protein